MYEIILGNRSVQYALRRSARVRSVRLSISAEHGLVVTIPLLFPLEELERVFSKKQNWILKNLDHVARQKTSTMIRQFNDGDEIEFLGEKYPIHITRYSGSSVTCALREKVLSIKVSEHVAEEKLKRYVKAIIEKWMLHQAKHYIPNRVAEINERTGYTYKRIAIKNQKSRWGSCSRQGNLNFNFRLMMAPVAVIDYVIIHELTHLRELNHSKKFWTMVEKYCPDFHLHKKWLKRCGGSLVL